MTGDDQMNDQKDLAEVIALISYGIGDLLHDISKEIEEIGKAFSHVKLNNTPETEL